MTTSKHEKRRSRALGALLAATALLPTAVAGQNNIPQGQQPPLPQSQPTRQQPGVYYQGQGYRYVQNADVVNFVQTRYPGCQIWEYDYDNGFMEVEIIHENRKKEVHFNSQNGWVYSEWDVWYGELPQPVVAAIQQSQWRSYYIDDLDYVEMPTRSYYKVELEFGEHEVKLYFDANGRAAQPWWYM